MYSVRGSPPPSPEGFGEVFRCSLPFYAAFICTALQGLVKFVEVVRCVWYCIHSLFAAFGEVLYSVTGFGAFIIAVFRCPVSLETTPCRICEKWPILWSLESRPQNSTRPGLRKFARIILLAAKFDPHYAVDRIMRPTYPV